MTTHPGIDREIWCYPIGLAIGFALDIYLGYEPEESSTKISK